MWRACSPGAMPTPTSMRPSPTFPPSSAASRRPVCLTRRSRSAVSASSYDAIPDFGLLYDSVPLYAARQDIAFYVQEAAAVRGPVLELGCGTGRILLPMARAGCTGVGLDNSRPMLARCRAKIAAEPAPVRAHVTLHEHDVRDFNLGA